MKHTATIEDVHHSFDEMSLSLTNHFERLNREEPESLKLANEYYKWISLKTHLILNEKIFQIPSSALPNIIKPSAFMWLHGEKQAVVSKYYRYDEPTDQYVISVKKSAVPETDINLIMQSLVLIRKTVVWVDFSVKVDKVYGFPEMPRWANVTRITQVSLSRVQYNKFGDVKSCVLKEICEKLKDCGII